jgi:chromosome segregation ATPase
MQNPISLITTPVLIRVSLALLLALAVSIGISWIWISHLYTSIDNKNLELSQQKTSIGTLTKNAATLQSNYLTCKDANDENQKTIKALTDERDANSAAVKSLSKKTAASLQKQKDLQSQLDALKKDPANDGAVSNILRAAIEGVQGGAK